MPISRLVRFIPRVLASSPSPSSARAIPSIGEPTDPLQDVGLASYSGADIEVDVYSGTSVLSPGSNTGRREMVDRLLSPLSPHEVGTVRCIGLNVRSPRSLSYSILSFRPPHLSLTSHFTSSYVITRADKQYHRHAAEMSMEKPTLPTLFLKPATALGDPYPAPTILPRAFLQDNAADYEAELAVVIGKDCKDVSEDQAMDYVLGYVSSSLLLSWSKADVAFQARQGT
jgi:2-keto-4-pentenoate hydratase/2-oxohepta-3-ene-1,7-dioic acid hydratase in catechol pathway